MRYLVVLVVILLLLLPAPSLPAAYPEVLPHPPIPPVIEPGLVAALLAESAERTAGATLSTGFLTCEAGFADSRVDELVGSTPWIEYLRRRTITSSQSFSAENSILLEGGATGQELSLPPNLVSLEGDLRYRYAPGSLGVNDRLLVQFYDPDNVLSSAGLVAQIELDPPGPDNGDWKLYEWLLDNEDSIAELRGIGSVVILFRTVDTSNGTTRNMGLDDLRVDICRDTASISGQISQANATSPDLSDAVLLLYRNSGFTRELVSAANPGANGNYVFSGLASLSDGESYQVWFMNAPLTATRTPGRIGFWAGPLITDLDTGPATNIDFDISDVGLTSPASFETKILNDRFSVRFNWTGRNIAGEYYQLCAYDPQRIDTATDAPPQVCSGVLTSNDANTFSTSLSLSSFRNAAAFGFGYGRSYRWYVVVYAQKPQEGVTVPYGYSFFEHALTFEAAATPPPVQPAPPEAGDPQAGNPAAEWTLLIYAAGDNALGDRLRVPGASRLDMQLMGLESLAVRYPNINIVTLLDTYGDTGTQVCYYPPGGSADCVERGEQNSASQLTLANFVALGRSRYPAERTMLWLASPGHAVGGVAVDETATGKPQMSLSDLRSALNVGLGGGDPIDVLVLQVPLMGTIDTAAALAPYVRYLVASASENWSIGFYAQVLAELNSSDGASGATAAVAVVTTYDAAVAARGVARARVIAAYDLSRAAAAAAALADLGNALRTGLDQNETVVRDLLSRARNRTQFYDSSTNGLINRLERTSGQPVAAPEDAFVDLLRFATFLQNDTATPAEVALAAENLIAIVDPDTIEPLILAVRRSSDARLSMPQAEGVAVLFPAPDLLGMQPTIRELYFYNTAAEPVAGWAAFLRDYLGGSLGGGLGGVTAAPDGGARLELSPGGLINDDLYLPFVGNGG
jgi:hypothetical protein